MADLERNTSETSRPPEPNDGIQRLLIEELNRIETKMQAERSTFQRVWALIFLVTGGGIAASSDRAGVVVPFLPIAVLFLGLLWAVSSREHQALGGYKHHLEEELNRTVAKNVVLWESRLVSGTDQTKITPRLIYGVLTLLWLILWVVAIKSTDDDLIKWFVGLLMLPSFAAMGLAMKEANDARHQTLIDARFHADQPFGTFGPVPKKSNKVSTLLSKPVYLLVRVFNGKSSSDTSELTKENE